MKVLPPEASRILFVKNLPANVSGETCYKIFGRYGGIRQLRLGSEPKTKGTCFVVYDDIFSAKSALDELTGFNVEGRYLTVLYYHAKKGN